ncbi:MAG: alpha/beta fold hydrolase [Acidobacteria bacterium]|nr:alpha/beta fold hydrolase [Acidobacteriota bacterium]
MSSVFFAVAIVVNQVNIVRQQISLQASDGRQLSARWWPGADAAERSVVFIPALAAPQEYLNFFAAFLAKQGWGVLTFDYRSVGSSRDGATDAQATLDDWANLDMPAAVAELKRLAKPKFLAAITHSIGGQLLGQSPIRHDVHGALFISSQRGIPKLYQGVGRLRIEYAYAVFPLLIGLLGRLPVSAYTLPTECSGRAVAQWVKWGRKGIFTAGSGANVEPRFAEFARPLTTVTISDDELYAPAAAVEALAQVYQRADVRREFIRPQDFAMEHIGHFGFFHRHASRQLWETADAWLRDLEARAGL